MPRVKGLTCRLGGIPAPFCTQFISAAAALWCRYTMTSQQAPMCVGPKRAAASRHPCTSWRSVRRCRASFEVARNALNERNKSEPLTMLIGSINSICCTCCWLSSKIKSALVLRSYTSVQIAWYFRTVLTIVIEHFLGSPCKVQAKSCKHGTVAP